MEESMFSFIVRVKIRIRNNLCIVNKQDLAQIMLLMCCHLQTLDKLQIIKG